MKYFDQHLHTRFSFDSKEEPENYINKAIGRGITRFISTEHVEFDYNGEDILPDFNAQKSLYTALEKKYPNMRLYCGAEIGYKSGRVKDALSIIEKYDFSLINLSVHDYKGVDVYYPKDIGLVSANEMIKWNLEKIAEAVESEIPFNTLCHVDYAFKSALTLDKRVNMSDHEDQLKTIFRSLISKDKALEINTKVQKAIADDAHTEYLVKTYLSLGGKFLTLSDDAHRVDSYLSHVEHYLDLLKRCGVNKLTFFIEGKPTLIDIDDCK